MTIYIKEIKLGEFYSRFRISGIPNEKQNDFQKFLGTKIASLGVKYDIDFSSMTYVTIHYPTKFFGLIELTKYHGIYLTWIMEWIDENNKTTIE